ncbi:uncharacterized protein B0H18DRAFT_839669, partial [Fomitopsis serialis]|uniref:uncharacterized protein n=1 Tax=Fomitopsis serialis TaxID=139415 RepID=UPI0020076C07
SILQRCKRIERNGAAVAFLIIIHHLQLLCKCTTLRRAESLSISEVYRRHIRGLDGAPRRRTFMYWIAAASKFAAVALGGSIYTLAIVAFANLRVPLMKSVGNLAWQLSNLLRDPEPTTPAGQAIIEHIIPAVASLRHSLPLTFDTLFPQRVLADLNMSTDTMACWNLVQSDEALSLLDLNTFTPIPRNLAAWGPCTSILEESQHIHLTSVSHRIFRLQYEDSASFDPPSPLTDISDNEMEGASSCAEVTDEPSPSSSHGATVTLQGFELCLDHHQRYPVPQDEDEAFAWTEEQCSLAKAASEHESLTEFIAKVRTMPSSIPGTYLTRPSCRACTAKAVGIEDEHGSLVVCVFSSMPESMRQTLASKMVACFEAQSANLEETDTASEGRSYRFPALHFSWYNRHGTRGHDIPPNVHPMLLEKEDHSRTNYTQMLPYPSRDMKKYEEIYHNLEEILGEVFEYMAEQARYLPDSLLEEYEVLSMDAEILPGNEHSIVHPFLSLVINLNVATLAH